MTANTPNYTIPYPEITDFVKDGATAMEAIAERIDSILLGHVANRNLLYNGAMQIAQRSTTAVTGITSENYYTIDRWRTTMATSGTWTQTPDTDVPTGQGFRRSLKMTCTATATPANYLIVNQRLEGQDLQAIRKGTASAKQMTLSFWVKSNKTGTYICELFDVDNSRSISKSYTINSAGVWEYKTILIATDTTGAFDNDNNSSLEVNFWLAAGTSYSSGTLQTNWASAVTANRAVGQTNLADTLNNYWQMTGAQLTIGAEDLPFQFKSFQQDLRECQRYYWKEHAGVTGQTGATYILDTVVGAACDQTTWVRYPLRCPVPMRANPSIVVSATGGNYTNLLAGGGYGGTATGGLTASYYCIVLYIYSAGIGLGTAGCLRLNNANAFIGGDAEL